MTFNPEGKNSRERYPHLYEMKACPVCGEAKLIAKKQTHCSRRCANLARTGKPLLAARGPRLHMRGSRGPSWKGDDVTYAALHYRVESARGKASEHVCKCGKSAKDWANLTGNYVDVNDYAAMCRKCHRALDAERRGAPILTKEERKQRDAARMRKKRALDRRRRLSANDSSG